MKKTVLGTLSGIKYVYLLLFFALLAGNFQPLVSEQGFLDVFKGIGVLFLGLAGTLLVYKATISSEPQLQQKFAFWPRLDFHYPTNHFNDEKWQGIFLIIGFGLIIISLILIYEIAGRSLL